MANLTVTSTSNTLQAHRWSNVDSHPYVSPFSEQHLNHHEQQLKFHTCNRCGSLLGAHGVFWPSSNMLTDKSKIVCPGDWILEYPEGRGFAIVEDSFFRQHYRKVDMTPFYDEPNTVEPEKNKETIPVSNETEALNSRIKKLRLALLKLSILGNEPNPGNSKGNQIAQAALKEDDEHLRDTRPDFSASSPQYRVDIKDIAPPEFKDSSEVDKLRQLLADEPDPQTQEINKRFTFVATENGLPPEHELRAAFDRLSGKMYVDNPVSVELQENPQNIISVQWWHPGDFSYVKPLSKEHSDQLCPECGEPLHYHGTITHEPTNPNSVVLLVCPGSWVVNEGNKFKVYSPAVFYQHFYFDGDTLHRRTNLKFEIKDDPHSIFNILYPREEEVQGMRSEFLLYLNQQLDKKPTTSVEPDATLDSDQQCGWIFIENGRLAFSLFNPKEGESPRGVSGVRRATAKNLLLELFAAWEQLAVARIRLGELKNQIRLHKDQIEHYVERTKHHSNSVDELEEEVKRLKDEVFKQAGSKKLLDHDEALKKAEVDEPGFVILARDPAAYAAMRAWMGERSKLIFAGQLPDNEAEKDHINRVLQLSEKMEIYRKQVWAPRGKKYRNVSDRWQQPQK